MKKKLALPKFKNEDEERDFWAKIDLTDYYDASDLESVSFPNLKTDFPLDFHSNSGVHFDAPERESQWFKYPLSNLD